MSRRLVLLLVASLVAVLAAAPRVLAQAETRVALVVGNGAYRHTSPLANPANDARLMAESLKVAGFAVDVVIDADQTSMKRALVDFGRRLRDSKAVGLFYYAGHGVQVGGRNYLIPVDANIQDETELGIESVSLDEFLATMERAENRINIVVLDACRNNPFQRGFRSAGGGLARADAPRGTFLAYATSPGAVAKDGVGANSPYTTAITKAIRTPGLALEQVFKTARRDVLEETQGSQVPWETSSITGDFFFVQGQSAAAAGAPPAKSADTDSAVEIAFWNSVKTSLNAAAYEAYLAQYPAGSFATPARVRMAELKASAAQVAAPPAAPPQPTLPQRRVAQIMPQSSTRELADAEVAGLDCNALWIARNEMFHRHGYCFETSRGIQHFGNEGCRTTRQDVLTETERRNFRTFRTAEIRKQCDAVRGGQAFAAAAPLAAVKPPPPPTAPASSQSPPPAAGITQAGAACDRLAAAAWDTDARAQGVAFAALDAAAAITACREAARTSPADRRFMFQLGRAHDKARDFAAARVAYEQAARLGSGAAMVNLGILYEKGQGVQRNQQEVRGWYERAARSGLPQGMFCYATTLDNGIGGPPRPGAAADLYRQAAALGHSEAARAAEQIRQRPGPTGTRCE